MKRFCSIALLPLIVSCSNDSHSSMTYEDYLDHNLKNWHPSSPTDAREHIETFAIKPFEYRGTWKVLRTGGMTGELLVITKVGGSYRLKYEALGCDGERVLHRTARVDTDGTLVLDKPVMTYGEEIYDRLYPLTIQTRDYMISPFHLQEIARQHSPTNPQMWAKHLQRIALHRFSDEALSRKQLVDSETQQSMTTNAAMLLKYTMEHRTNYSMATP